VLIYFLYFGGQLKNRKTMKYIYAIATAVFTILTYKLIEGGEGSYSIAFCAFLVGCYFSLTFNEISEGKL